MLLGEKDLEVITTYSQNDKDHREPKKILWEFIFTINNTIKTGPLDNAINYSRVLIGLASIHAWDITHYKFMGCPRNGIHEIASFLVFLAK